MKEKRHSRDLVRFHRMRKIGSRKRQLDNVRWPIQDMPIGKLSRHHPRQWCSCFLCTKCYKSSFEAKTSEWRKSCFYVETSGTDAKFNNSKRIHVS